MLPVGGEAAWQQEATGDEERKKEAFCWGEPHRPPDCGMVNCSSGRHQHAVKPLNTTDLILPACSVCLYCGRPSQPTMTALRLPGRPPLHTGPARHSPPPHRTPGSATSRALIHTNVALFGHIVWEQYSLDIY